MNDLQSTISNQTIFTAVVGAFVTLLAWLGKRLHSRVDGTVSRNEFNETLNEFRAERLRMHDENRETLNRIHERVDDLWKNQYQR
jgi:hypothetical protein